MPSDPLSEILELLDARTVVTNGMEVGGEWAFCCQAPIGLKFIAVVRGNAWIIPSELDTIALQPGDVLLLNGSTQYVLASDPDVEPLDAAMIFSEATDGIGRWGNTAEVVLLGGRVELDRKRGSLLLDVLPPLIHLSGADREAAAIRWMIARLFDEAGSNRPGATLITGQLSQLIVVHLIRSYLEREKASVTGWLGGLADEKIARALTLMHSDPARKWTLNDLARLNGLSRTAFAVRFKARTGMTALAYLQRWRMHLAEKALGKQGASVAAVANLLGYNSESAFSTAFKRVIGSAPRRYLQSSR